MIICGLKLTHDGAVALVDGDELIFSIEMEKLDNNPRYSPVADLRIVAELLAEFGYRVCDVDEWVIDGWNGRESGHVSLLNHGMPVDLVVAPYREAERIRGRLPVAHRGRFRIGADELEYSSHVHVAGHLAAAYCTSPFAAAGEPALVLVWDGGMFPRMYHVAPDGAVESGGELFRLVGVAYPTAAHHFGPYRRDDEPETVVDLSVAGKLMAYIALGKVQREIVDVLREQFHERFESAAPVAVRYREEVGGWGIPFDPSLRYLHARPGKTGGGYATSVWWSVVWVKLGYQRW
jgi:carbamoyltransferase